MAKYGIPYVGSKNRFADEILSVLPEGRRFVDLFGGGFAMSHAALLSNKYDEVLYNDIDPQVVQLVNDTIAGKYSPENFTPEFITREKFFKYKDSDAYIRGLGSFGSDGCSYMYGKETEAIKHAAHDWVVFNRFDEEILGEIIPPDKRKLQGETIQERRLSLAKLVRKMLEKR